MTMPVDPGPNATPAQKIAYSQAQQAWLTSVNNGTARLSGGTTGQGATPPTTTTTGGLSAVQQSAQATINAALAEWGLQGLGASAWQSYLTGTPIDTIMQNIRQSNEYQQRFPGMKQLQDQGQAISEADYIAKERADTELLRAYGIPDGLVNRDELGNLIGNQVSTNELQSRLNDYQQVVMQLPHEVRDYMQREQGVSTGDLMGYWLNPDVAAPILDQQTKAAAVGGAAAVSGFGDIDPATALRLAGMQSSLYGDFKNTLTEFGKAQQMRGLTQALPGQQAGLTTDQLLNAEVGGDANAQLAEQKAAETAKAQFAGGGDYMLGSKGASGLGPNLS